MEDRLPRKLAAILYADVVGYSRLANRSEEATHKLLLERLELFAGEIAAREGKKVNEAGDAILAEFKSITDAVNCAVIVQLKMASLNSDLTEDDKFQFRIGVHIGEVIPDRDDIYGDGVNLAARIQGLADPGGICVSNIVYEQVRGKTDLVFDDMGYHKVKNIDQPVHVYRAYDSDKRITVNATPSFDFEDFETERDALITGGCQCGNIRYEINQPPSGAGFCHCRMCQRTIGAVVDAWVAFPIEAVRFTSGDPKYYTSSPIAKRGFCENCGSSLLLKYYAPTESKLLIMMTGCLDNPKDFPPTWHSCIESQMPWLDIHDDLPRGHSRESDILIERWGGVGIANPADWK